MILHDIRTPFGGDAGAELDPGVGNFAIIVAITPEPEMVCYGILNKATGIIEAMVPSFAKAKWLVKEFHLDDTQGYERQQTTQAGGVSLLDLLRGGGNGDDIPPTGGKAN